MKDHTASPGTSSADSAATSSPGPVYISGRIHSGNTMLAFVFKRVPGCYSLDNEGLFFPNRSRLDKMQDPVRRARWIGEYLRLRDDEQLEKDATERLVAWATENPRADALAQYFEAMRFLLEKTENSFWAQKGTGFIFQLDEILKAVPNSKFIYSVRNPYDVCASRKRRFPNRERITGWVTSWNKGLQIAREYRQRCPDRVLIVRYEDLTRDPHAEVARICEFVGVPFDEDYLDIPHVNPAEAQLQVMAGARGINTSKLLRYRDELRPSEIAAIDMLVDKQLLKEYFPELPHLLARTPILARLGGLGLLLIGPVWYLFGKMHFSRKATAPRFGAWLRQRLTRRTA